MQLPSPRSTSPAPPSDLPRPRTVASPALQHFDCRDQLPQQRLVPVEKLLDMYAAKQLSRSTLVAGLERATEPQLGRLAYVPAAFLRPLEYVLELVEASPALYRPITSEDLSAGLPRPDWCLPLHMELTASDTSGNGDDHGAAQAERQQKGSAPLQPFAGNEATATAAFSGAPYW